MHEEGDVHKIHTIKLNTIASTTGVQATRKKKNFTENDYLFSWLRREDLRLVVETRMICVYAVNLPTIVLRDLIIW